MDEDFKAQALDSTVQSQSETLLSIRLLDFKTSLIEAIEELRIRRETEINYEDQISKIVVEKQELEWQKETLQHQTDTLHQQNKEAMAAFKKQLQARMFAMEEEKGKYQLAVETKEKEIDGLKEALKALQISKYTLQKKLNEMDHKLQMHITAKEEHHKKLNEVERCYATIACQFGIVKGVHGKLEHSVQEAMQLNKKLTLVNRRQETEISNLKEELKKVTTDLIRSKVTSQYRVGEENINLAAKEKQFQELQQKIRMEAVLSKKVQEENTHIKEEKLEILSSLQCVQELLQRITQTNVRMESELNALKEDYQTLERDNELQREKAKENEEKFLNLQNEHEKALRTWKKDAEVTQTKGTPERPSAQEKKKQLQIASRRDGEGRGPDLMGIIYDVLWGERESEKEENMKREIDTIKNELNSLKGVHRHHEDDHPPQGNQHSEQVENQQSGQEHSEESEIQVIQEENGCMQSIIREDCNFGHEEIEVKSTTVCSLSTEELQTEQSLQVLENSFKDEINVASPYDKKQREASPRNTLCTDTDLITQGQTSEIYVTECKEAETLEAAHGVLLDGNSANLEEKPQASTEPLAPSHMQTRKVFSDGIDALSAYKKNGSQDTDCRQQGLCNATDESICTKADQKSNTIQHKSILIPQAPRPDSEVVVCTEKNAVCERSPDNQAKELSFGILPSIKENSQTEHQKCLLDGDNGLHKTGKKVLNLNGSHKLPFKQTQVDGEDGTDDDDARNINRNGAQRSIDVPAIDAQSLSTVYCAKASSDDATKEHRNMPLLSTFNLMPPKTERGVYGDAVHSKQPEQDSTEQTGQDINLHTLNTEAVAPGKADGLEIIAHRKTPTDRTSTDKLIPCKANDDIQIHSIKNGQSLESNNSTNNTLLKEQKDSLNSTVPGRKFAEGNLKESCSLPMRTSGNLVNISGRSSFDLSTSDKKAEKTPVYLNFLDLGSCSRVNQMRGQATWTSVSKEPFLFKEKLPYLVGNTKVISRTQCQNLSENIDRRETGLGSTSFNRAADTLNTSSIHRDPQGDPSEEWNATAKTFYDSSFPTEHHEQKSSHMAVTPARSGSALGAGESCSIHNSIMQNQIEEIEKFLHLGRRHSARKRTYEEGQ